MKYTYVVIDNHKKIWKLCVRIDWSTSEKKCNERYRFYENETVLVTGKIEYRSI